MRLSVLVFAALSAASPVPAQPSPAAALALSAAAGTLPLLLAVHIGDGRQPLPAILGTLGFVVGPSTGHFLVGRTGLLVPRAVTTAAAIGLAVALPANEASGEEGNPVVLIPVLAAASLWFVDIVTAPAAVRDRRRDFGVFVSNEPAAGTMRIGLRMGLSIAAMVKD